MVDDKMPRLTGPTIVMTREQYAEWESFAPLRASIDRQMRETLEYLRHPVPAEERTSPVTVEPKRRWPSWLRSLVLRLIPDSLWRELLEDEGYDPDDTGW